MSSAKKRGLASAQAITIHQKQAPVALRLLLLPFPVAVRKVKIAGRILQPGNAVEELVALAAGNSLGEDLRHPRFAAKDIQAVRDGPRQQWLGVQSEF